MLHANQLEAVDSLDFDFDMTLHDAASLELLTECTSCYVNVQNVYYVLSGEATAVFPVSALNIIFFPAY